ncbi:choline dehydrogenase [Jatrophihabitans endophyticus]|uniref:Choline dehydrogenase n=1 Tax=Jatrophihabitans endophyticus TaxID=1206085 RepID=A0A1M5RE73_9ACTN|nr:GMC family oxidoreductase N-terminal domain-containing protein [Jatrophihabitans endophyticus]SHH24564.1 choline dehydrogenase [Jatrophihabitans endophyticus]
MTGAGTLVADYVVVGAGSAGCVLASRLSAVPDTSVVLVEAGDADRRAELSVPAAYPRLFGTSADWGFETVAQPGLGGRRVAWPRGRVLGGSSALNAQIWTRGHPADFDAWAAAGCSGWAWADVLPYFCRAEQLTGAVATAPAERPSPRVDRPGALGRHGSVRLTGLRDPSPATAAFLAACAQAGLPRLAAEGDGRDEGYAPVLVTQHHGRRWSAVDAYLRPAAGRDSLTVLTGARLRAITFDAAAATGVEVVTAAGVVHVAARREVLLAAGAIGSPWALLDAGIGDAAALRAAGRPVRVHRPEVGRNLADHLYVPVSATSPHALSPGVGDQRAGAAEYLARRRGPLTSNLAEALAFVRTDPALVAPDIELLWLVVPRLDQPSRHGVTVASVLLQPASRGRVALDPAAPDAAPVIDAGYLTDPDGADLTTLLRGVARARQVLTRPALAAWCDPDLAGGDVALCRGSAQTLYHPVGTCRMGADADAVLDPQLRVRGVERLRVVDASAMPTITRAHTQAPTVMLAERAADLVVADSPARRERAPAGVPG